MTDSHTSDPPSTFIETWIERLSPPPRRRARAFDVAMGRGRHAVLLAAHGFRTLGVDINYEALADARERAHGRGLELHVWCADLERSTLPLRRFDLIVVARYLQRTLTAALVDALAPGGILLYETFTERQRERGRGPRSPDHLLKEGELRSLFGELDELFYEELTDPAEDALARLAARKRSNPS